MKQTMKYMELALFSDCCDENMKNIKKEQKIIDKV